jgi:hypothetical protein
MKKKVDFVIDEKKLIEELKKRIASHEKDADDFAGETIYSHITETLLRIADETEAVIELVEKQPKVGEWIPCSERLPEEEKLLYWTTHEDGSLVLHGYTKRSGFIYNWEVDDLEKRKRQGQVVAWVPILEPEPYKGE